MSSILIEELTGRKRQLTLVGGGLPFQGANWSTEHAITTTWNPGSPVAVQHVFGPQEMPSDWEGEWNTTRLIKAPPLWVDGGPERTLVLADDVYRAMNALVASGQLLRVTWVAAENRRFARYGRLQKLDPKFDRADDIKWSATFAWIGRFDAAVAVVQSDQGASAARALALAATDAQSRIESAAFISANPKVPLSATTFSLGQLEQLADAPLQTAKSFARAGESIVNRVNAVAGIIEKVRDVPYEVVQQFVDVAIEAVGTSNRFVDAMSRESYESWTTRNTLSSLLRAATYYSSSQEGAEILAEKAMTAARDAQKRRTADQRAGSDPRSLTGAGDILKIILPKAGETLTTIAIREYRQDLSFELARANGLPGDTVTPPRISLIIPTLAVLQRLRSPTGAS